VDRDTPVSRTPTICHQEIFLAPLPGTEEEEAPTSTTRSHVKYTPAAIFLVPLPGTEEEEAPTSTTRSHINYAPAGAILLMCVWTRDPMENTELLKESIEVPVFTSPVRLNMDNFLIKEALNMILKLQKDIKHIRFAFKKVETSKTTKSINKTHTIVVSTNRNLGRTPHIGINKLKRRSSYSTRL
jgi:hypothetical protein